MNRVLALDTSTWWGGLALLEQEEPARPPRLVAELGVQVRRSHAGHVLGWADWLLSRAGWSRAALDGFVATCGPGSFTGIRVGLGTVRGLALAADRPCVGVTTLEALAEAHGPAAGDRVALLAAGRGELFGQRFDPSSSPAVPAEEPWVRPVDFLPGICSAGTVPVLAPGVEELTGSLRFAAGRAVTVRGVAAAAGRLALLRRFPDRDPSPPLAPLYVRPPDVADPGPDHS